MLFSYMSSMYVDRKHFHSYQPYIQMNPVLIVFVYGNMQLYHFWREISQFFSMMTTFEVYFYFFLTFANNRQYNRLTPA